MLGTAILSNCTTYSPPFCDATDVPVPGVSYGTITATYTVQTNFDGDIGKLDYTITTLAGYVFCYQNYLATYQARFPFAVTEVVESWTTDSTSTGTAVWTLSATTVVSGSAGVYKRPGTNQVLVTSITWKANQYTYSLSSATGNHTDYAVVTNGYDVYNSCCSTSPSPQYFDTISPGGSVSRTPLADSTLTMRWIGASTTTVSGFNLTLTAAGIALAPWIVEVTGGSVVFTDKNGAQTSYSGSLTSVRTTINAWPTAGGRYFTAAIPGNINAVAQTTDLKPYRSPPLNRTTCTTGLPIVLVGEKITPSSTLCSIAGFAFSTSLGYTDDEEGALSFITATRYPKSSGFTSGTYYYISTEFDGYLFPGSTPSVWNETPGSSIQTNDYTLESKISYYNTQTLVTARCKTPAEGESNCTEVLDPFCNVYSPTVDCDGNPYPPGCFPWGVCWCEHLESTEVFHPELTLTATQVLEGSFVLS
jgi:hypothetical protein